MWFVGLYGLAIAGILTLIAVVTAPLWAWAARGVIGVLIRQVRDAVAAGERTVQQGREDLTK